MQLSIKLLTLCATLGVQVGNVLADCGSTCYNPAGTNGCIKESIGLQICKDFWDNSSSCRYCMRVNCGGYGSSQEIADKTFCSAKGWGRRDAADEDAEVNPEHVDWVSVLDGAQAA